MPTYKRCDDSVELMAAEILERFETHLPLLNAKVRIDYIFAFPDYDDEGRPTNDALKKNGVKALGLTRKMQLKDRTMGRGDAEILLDWEWWNAATEAEQSALLDHELHHLAIKSDRNGAVSTDDLGRPELKLRKHDVEIGWFKIVAERHGQHSMERVQARQLFDEYGQAFWPQFVPTVEQAA